MRPLVFLLLFGLWPGAAEAVVDVGHALREGHSAHGADCHDDDNSDGHDEHRCSATFHLCGCHAPAPTSPTFTAAAVIDTRWSELGAPDIAPMTSLVQPADGAAPRTSRPPIL